MRDPDAPLLNFAISYKGASWTDPDAVPLMLAQQLLGSWNKQVGGFMFNFIGKGNWRYVERLCETLTLKFNHFWQSACSSNFMHLCNKKLANDSSIRRECTSCRHAQFSKCFTRSLTSLSPFSFFVISLLSSLPVRRG